MNAFDHPHGGKTRGGIQPKTPWGKQAKWKKK
jgi:ribosomal protein L2